MTRKLWRVWLAGALISAGWIMLNAGKPFHIDDSFHLMWARTIHPLSGEQPVTTVSWQRYDEPMAAQTRHHPPGWSLLLSEVRRFADEREWVMHWLQWPFAVAFLIGATLIAARFGQSPWMALALTATSPLFLLPTTSVMPDIPSAGPAILGIAIWLTAQTLPARAAAAGCLILAAQMKQSAIPLLPLLAIDPPARVSRSLTRWGWIVTIAILGGWFPDVAPFTEEGNSIVAHLLGILGRAGGVPLAIPKIGYAFAVVAAAVVFPFGYAALLVTFGPRGTLKAAGGAVAVIIVLSALGFWKGFIHGGWGMNPVPGSFNTLWFYVAIGACAVWGWTLLRPKLRGDVGWLAIWLALAFAGYLVGSPFPAARHLVTIVPAVVVMLLVTVGAIESVRLRRVILGTVIAGNVWVSASLALTDYRFAGVAPEAAAKGRKLAATLHLPLVTTGSWGLRYYVERSGGSELLRAADLLPGGAVLLVPSFSDHRIPSARIVRRARHRETWVFPAPPSWLAPVRTIPDPHTAASFHGGPYWFPYAFSRRPIEMIKVYVIPPLPTGARR